MLDGECGRVGERERQQYKRDGRREGQREPDGECVRGESTRDSDTQNSEADEDSAKHNNNNTPRSALTDADEVSITALHPPIM